MSVDVLVTDTHPLIWYLAGNTSHLTVKVRSVFDRAVAGEAAIYVPTVVLWELSLLLKAGKVRLTVALDDYVSERFFARAIHLVDLLPEDVLRAHALAFSSDPFDTMIVAVAQRLECPLITRDSVIHGTAPCPLFWD